MANWFAQMHLRNHRSWEAISARMSPECRLAWTTTAPARAEALDAIWIKSPWAAFRDAGLLMEMADYAERNSLSEDSARMQTVRASALQLRLAATGAMIRRISLR